MSPPGVDEADMMEMQRDDIGAFARLFQRHRSNVYRYFVYHLRDTEDAADLLQQTFVRLWEARGQYRSGAPFGPWLYTLAANLRRDAHRRAAVRERHARSIDPAPPQAVDAHRDLEGAQEARRALDALARLPEAQREAVVLAKLHGLDYRQIGEALGISPDAAKLRVFRGLQALREELT